ncbi:MAG: glycosyltransferase family 1 protein [Kiritimatiellae bacterium]|nr:glycosyltransferase family 1 protein [Kiritimatiellia bacterium]MDD5521812.1 glycosyltransferase family 1 protein [Kiritimatiellia bacterium]
MRLALVNLTGGGFSGGYKKYLKNMLPRLAEHNDVDALLCVSPRGNDITGWFDKLPKADYCSCRPLSLSHFAHIPDRKMVECLEKFSPDIIFLPVDRYICFGDIPVVNMVRNMEVFIPNMPGDTIQERIRKFIQLRLTCASVRRANHTIAVSNFVKQCLVDRLGIKEDKISMVYHGLNHTTERSNDVRPALIPSGWKDGFLFTCGSVRPARGLEDILQALAHLKAQNVNIRLVIAGETVTGMKNYRDGLVQWFEANGLSDSVCWVGNLNEDEINWCYGHCTLFVMTSRVEACPNIALEAMSYGCVSVASENPPLPEFFGASALYYPPKDFATLAKKIQVAISVGQAEKVKISNTAKEIASRFSWDVCAQKTVDELQKVLK